jgi:hypothetical protein
MKDIQRYVSLIVSTIRHSVATDDEVTYSTDSPLSGTIDGKLYFHDGSRLEFSEQVYLHQGHPIKKTYRYQYVKGKKSIFRYDNAPHHRRIPTFPHHKHVRNKVIAAGEPTLGQVLNEIADLMAMDDPEKE